MGVKHLVGQILPVSLKSAIKKIAIKPLNLLAKRKKNSCSSLYGLCAACRRKDSHTAFRSLIDDIRVALGQKNIAFIEHESSTSEYHFFVPVVCQINIKQMIKKIQEKSLYIEYKKVALGANKYEVDGTDLILPPETGYWVLNPRGQCNKGKEIFSRWSLKISFFSDHDHARLFHLRNNLVRVLPPKQKIPARLKDLWAEARFDDKPLQLEMPNFPVDLVYTWVDNSDEKWEALRAKYSNEKNNEEKGLKSAGNKARFFNRNEILFSLRSVFMYAPFVRHIYILTDNQVSHWLDLKNDRIKIVSHEEIFDEETEYPVFSSRPIEFNLHRIPDLSEHFIYMNDDFFFCGPVKKDDFFFANGIAKVYTSSRLLDSRAVQTTDRATVVSHKNASAAFQRHLGVTPTGKFKHVPYSVRRSACYEVQEVFSDEVRQSKANRFRSWDDISWSFVLPHYMLFKGYAVPQDIPNLYLDVHDKGLPAKLLSTSYELELKFLCLNDADGEGESPNESYLQEWMQERFPLKAPWEVGPHK